MNKIQSMTFFGKEYNSFSDTELKQKFNNVVTEIPASANIYPAYSVDKWVDGEVHFGFTDTNENCCYSAPILVKPNTRYSMTHNPYKVSDVDGEYVVDGEISLDETVGTVWYFTTRPYCTEIYITINKTDFGGTTDIDTAVENFNSVFMLVEGNTLPTEFETYTKSRYKLNENIEIPNYVTPQMFGAVADGITDDTKAIETAMNYGEPVLLCGEYAVSDLITSTASYICGINTKINILNDIDTIFRFKSATNISGIEFDCKNHNVHSCMTLSDINNIKLSNIYIHDIHNYKNDKGTTLINIVQPETANIDGIHIENCCQLGNENIADAQGNITGIYVTGYTKKCSIQNIIINEIHNFKIVNEEEIPLFEDSNGIYIRSGEKTAESYIKNIYGYNFGKRLIKTQCAGHVIIDGMTSYNNSIECLSAIGVMTYEDSSTGLVFGKASISNCSLINECTDITNAQYLIASNIETTIMNCILKSGTNHLAIYNDHKMTIYNCDVTGNGVHIDSGDYTYIYNCQFDIESEGIFLREYGASTDATVKVTDCTITCGRSNLFHAQLYIDNCWIDWCHIESYNFTKLTNSTILGSAQVVYIGGTGELIAENLTLLAKEVSSIEYAFDIGSSAIARITNINTKNFLYDVRVNSGSAILRGVNMEKVHCANATYFENYPEYVENLPNPAFMAEGAKVIWTSDNKLYKFTEGKWITDETGSSSGVIINVDQSYNPNSANAQSGVAVAEAIQDKFTTTTENEQPTYGEELINAENWIIEGWTGDLVNGFTHTAGNTNSLIFTMPEETKTNTYRISFDCSSVPGVKAIMVRCGNSELFDPNIQNSTSIIVGIKSVENGNLEFVPSEDFTGKIANISVKKITAISIAKQAIINSAIKTACELRTGQDEQNNIFFGKFSGEQNINGHSCVALGNGALRYNTSGFRNIGIGYNSLVYNTTGSFNIGIGYASLLRNISGKNNLAIGNGTLNNNIIGDYNMAMGAAALYNNINGSQNTGIGYQALYANTVGNSNLGIGSQTLAKNSSGSFNVGVGAEALNTNTTGSYNVAIGAKALTKNNTANFNVAIGYTALYGCKNGVGNIGIGMGAGRGDNGLFSYGVFIGYNTGQKLVDGANYNTFIGYCAGDEVTTGKKNILIGIDVQPPTPETSDWINVGNLFEGSVNTADKYAKINGGLQLSEIPTVDPSIDGRVWNDNGVLRVSNSNLNSSNLITLPEVTEADNGKILMVVNGKWQAVSVEGLTIITENEEEIPLSETY